MYEMKEGVQVVIDNWYKNTDHTIVHYWEQDDTWFVVVKYGPGGIHPELNYTKFDFCRIFPSFRLKGEYHISIDKTVNV